MSKPKRPAHEEQTPTAQANGLGTAESQAQPSLDDRQIPPEPEQDLAENGELIAALKEQIAVLEDRALRATAEVQNVQRAARRDVSEAAQFGVARLIEALLPAVDALEESLTHLDAKATKTLGKGLELTAQELAKAFAQVSAVKIEVAAGEPFNPEQHQALGMQPSDQWEVGQVVSCLRYGWMLHQRVIRPAMVIVAAEGKPPPAGEGEAGAGEEPSKLATSGAADAPKLHQPHHSNP